MLHLIFHLFSYPGTFIPKMQPIAKEGVEGGTIWILIGDPKLGLGPPVTKVDIQNVTALR